MNNIVQKCSHNVVNGTIIVFTEWTTSVPIEAHLKKGVYLRITFDQDICMYLYGNKNLNEIVFLLRDCDSQNSC